MDQIIKKIKHRIGEVEQTLTTLSEVKKKKDGVIERRDHKFIYRESWKEDKLHGLTEWFDLDGNLKLRESYIEGKLHGIQERYMFPSCSLDSISHWENGIRSGLHTIFKEDGTKISSYTYVSDMIYGECKFYYPDGTLKKEGFMSVSEPLGVWKLYDEEGRLRDTIDFDVR